jgi:hypothetical protein
MARGAIGFDAVKHLVLCGIERRPPRLDMTVYPYLPKAHVAMTLAKTYLGSSREIRHWCSVKDMQSFSSRCNGAKTGSTKADLNRCSNV